MLLIVVLLSLHLQPTTPLGLPDLHVGDRKVRHVKFSRHNASGDDVYDAMVQAVKSGQPTLFSGLVEEWPALELWSDMEHLTSLFGPESIRVKVSDTPTFTLHALDNRRPSELQGKAAPPSDQGYNWYDMKVEDIFKPEDGLYRYFTGEVPPAARADVNMTQLSIDLIGNSSGTNKMSRGMLWMGSAGVTAQTHHDRSYNFFAQIVGRKAFYIFSPSKWQELGMHPSYHGSRRQSRKIFPLREASSREILTGKGRSVSFDGSSCSAGPVEGTCASYDPEAPESDPGDSEADALEIFLDPGDVLFIPPFNFHSVVSLSSTTISYSVLSPSLEEFHFADALYAQVPFGLLKNRPPRVLRIAIVAYINRILKELGLDRRAFMYRLGRSRHDIAAAEGDDYQVTQPQDDNVKKKIEKLWCRPKTRLERMKIERSLGPQFFSAVKNVTKVFKEKHNYDRGVIEILVQDLVEELIVFMLSKEEYAHSVQDIIETCWLTK